MNNGDLMRISTILVTSVEKNFICLTMNTSLKVMTVIQTMMITLVMMAVLTTAITVLKNPNILRHIMRNNIGRMNCDVMHKSRSGKKLKG